MIHHLLNGLVLEHLADRNAMLHLYTTTEIGRSEIFAVELSVNAPCQSASAGKYSISVHEVKESTNSLLLILERLESVSSQEVREPLLQLWSDFCLEHL